MFLCYQSDSIIQHCIFILHEICYGLGYLMMGRYAYTFHGETFRRDVRLAGRDTEIGPLFGTERTGAIAGIPSGSFADEGDNSGEQIDFTLLGGVVGLHDVALADAVWLCFADEVLADVYSIHAVSSAVSTYVYNEVW